MKRAVVAASTASIVIVPLYFYISDSQSSFYKYALKAGKKFTENDAEFAHKAGVYLAKHSIVPTDRVGNDSRLAVKVWGINFPNPIGLAAGFDKNAECMQSMLSGGLGFGFVEIGSVTPLPQPGNPVPRVFRLSKDSAIINRYGFNSDGLDVVKNNLQLYRANQKTSGRDSEGLVGVNFGKNKDTEEALGDYVLGVKELSVFADYIVINVSSPNTKGLRSLQGKTQLHHLLSGVKEALQSTVDDMEYASKSCSYYSGFRPPLLIKISPDMTDSELADVASVALELEIDGIIISNTTIGERDNLEETELAKESGGLSGKPLLNIANATLSRMYLLTNGQIPIIGVGGISSAKDVYEKMKLGASLVQLYTALIYEGPGLPATIKQELLQLLKDDGYKCIEEAIGTAHNLKRKGSDDTETETTFVNEGFEKKKY
jgi:dihydroorotate dehydrogenase